VSAPVVDVVAGTLPLLALCGVGWLSGLGALTLAGTPSGPGPRLLAAPAAATLIWALAGNLLGRAGVPLKLGTPLIWLGAGALAVLGGRWLWREARPGVAPGGERPDARTWLVLVAAVVLVAWPLLVRGLTAHLGSMNLDTAYYTSGAAYFWEHGAGEPAGMADFYERYVDDPRRRQVLLEGRNHTYVLLAVLSPLVEAGEPLFVRNVFVCWSLVVLATGLAFWAWTARARLGAPGAGGGPAAYALLTMATGWAVVPALVGNWDNALAAPLGPLLAGLLLEPGSTWRRGTVLGVVGAYTIHTYPEVAPFLLVTLLPFALREPGGGWRDRRSMRAYAVGGALGLALLAPALAPLGRFFFAQAGQVGRAGGPFAAGLAAHGANPGGWWGLGPEHPWGADSGWHDALGMGLTALLAVGVLRRARHPYRADVAGLGIAVALALYFAIVPRYGYAVYKILSVSWWLVGWFLVDGVAAAGARVRALRSSGRRWRPAAGRSLAALVLATLIGSGALAARARWDTYSPPLSFRPPPSLRALAALRDAARREPRRVVLVAPEDPGSHVLPWVFHVLRDTTHVLYHSVHADAYAPGGRALPPDVRVDSVLTASDRAWVQSRLRPRFRTAGFSLLATEDDLVVEHVANANGVEAWGAWVGPEPLTLVVSSPTARRVTLTADLSAGPSIPGSDARTLTVRLDAREVGRLPFTGPTCARFEFPVEAGYHLVALAAPDRPTLPVLPNGDTRPLVVGLHAVDVASAPGRPTGDPTAAVGACDAPAAALGDATRR
jgi:hypothetical protein